MRSPGLQGALWLVAVAPWTLQELACTRFCCATIQMFADVGSAHCICRAFHTDKITTLRRRFDAEEYLKCNYVAETGNSIGRRLQQLVDRLRGQQLSSAEGIVVSKHSLMLFVGKGVKTSTRFHVDWTQAKNVALAFSKTVR